MAHQEVPPEPPAEQIAGRVAGSCREPHEEEERLDRDVARARHGATEHHGELAGHEQADERGGLEVGEDRDEHVRPVAERRRKPRERVVEAREAVELEAVAGEQRGDRRACQSRGGGERLATQREEGKQRECCDERKRSHRR